VFVLNVNDGSFPNEFAAGKPAQIEEERRLLYVGITRAKRDLHLVAPLKFFVTQQSRWGDKHVYGARSRFLTEPVLAAFESRVWPAEHERSTDSRVSSNVRIDAAARMLDMWEQ